MRKGMIYLKWRLQLVFVLVGVIFVLIPAMVTGRVNAASGVHHADHLSSHKGAGGSWSPSSFQITALWTSAGNRQDLTALGPSEFFKFRQTVDRERDPASGKMIKWEGVLLSKLMDSLLGGLSIEARAQVDLVILRNRTGLAAFIPRALIVKYPILLARAEDTFHSVIPWTSNPKILKEDVPLESFYLSDVVQIEFTNYRDRFSSFLLKRRTDPSAIRGEKLFVQNCVTCHMMRESSSLPVEALSKMGTQDGELDFKWSKHPTSFKTKFTGREQKFIIRYLQARRLENPVSVSDVMIHRSVQ